MQRTNRRRQADPEWDRRSRTLAAILGSSLGAAIQAGETFALLGLNETYGADEVAAYLGAIEQGLGQAIELLRAA